MKEMRSNPFPNRVTLYNLWSQTNSDDAEFMARLTTFNAVHAIVGIEGELDRADTVASTARGEGRQSMETNIGMLLHDPGMMAECIAVQCVLTCADGFCAEAPSAKPAARQQARARLEGEIGSALIAALPADVVSTIDRVARQAISEALSAPTTDAASVVTSVEEADVSAAASDAVAGVQQSLRVVVNRFVRERNVLLATGRVSEARAIDEAVNAWLAERITALDAVATQADDEREQRLAEANAALANATDSGAQPAGRPARNWTSARFLRFLFDEAPAGSRAETAAGTDALVTPLRNALRASIGRAAANRLRVATVALQGASAMSAVDVERLVGPVRALGDRARAALADLNERVRQRQQRISGTFLPAMTDVRDAIRDSAIGLAPDVLITRVIRTPLAACLENGRAIEEDDFENQALAAARDLTRSLRSANISQALEHVSDARLEQLAADLAGLSPTLAFREGYPPPQVTKRVAVPGGESSRLGRAIRARFPGVSVTPSSHPLVAYGVAITDVFAVTDLRDYHGRWHEAREQARRDGWDKRLVSDRQLLDFDDGITTDDDLDRMVVMAVACGALAPSKETPAGGTWYFVPAGQIQRPAEIDTARLDAVFAGFRAGRSLPDIRRTVRHSPVDRELIEQRWATWCADVQLATRSARLDALVSDALLPSDDLATVCRAIKAELHRERRSRFGAA